MLKSLLFVTTLNTFSVDLAKTIQTKLNPKFESFDKEFDKQMEILKKEDYLSENAFQISNDLKLLFKEYVNFCLANYESIKSLSGSILVKLNNNEINTNLELATIFYPVFKQLLNNLELVTKNIHSNIEPLDKIYKAKLQLTTDIKNALDSILASAPNTPLSEEEKTKLKNICTKISLTDLTKEKVEDISELIKNDLDSTFELLCQFFKEEYSNYKNNQSGSLIYDFRDQFLALILEIASILNVKWFDILCNKLII